MLKKITIELNSNELLTASKKYIPKEFESIENPDENYVIENLDSKLVNNVCSVTLTIVKKMDFEF